MGFKKNIQSSSYAVIAGSNDASLFEPGFKYVVDGVMYTVQEKYHSDNTEFRRVVTSEGGKEDLTVDSIRRDLNIASAKILEDPTEQSS